ncbi:hypothetical protein A1O7_06285 [Cladophialophora yegresii CBS 114405]|uniref:Acyltransferase 3 domain-containing protein n=1 Tax=Cladophialophora yegresii CBS 114405 TaxID=1182544 RepID=W9W1K7_9EURO|nr:uncharacterized protein A1O7_06285 [Cladophialophora yegresii CBS 114405]EXJ58855.1 hypothetical protein A1O7_06285 [Cladophialophora yegresii CBS 114405]
MPDAKTAASLAFAYFVAALLRFLQPGWLKKKRELHSTACLGALRGWAALPVFWFHMFYNRNWALQLVCIRRLSQRTSNGRGLLRHFGLFRYSAIAFSM